MKRTITFTLLKEIDIETPCFRKRGDYIYAILDDVCVKVDFGRWPSIYSLPVDVSTPWGEDVEDATELEFYTAYAATRNRLDIAANVENHQLDQTYLEQVAEE